MIIKKILPLILPFLISNNVFAATYYIDETGSGPNYVKYTDSVTACSEPTAWTPTTDIEAIITAKGANNTYNFCSATFSGTELDAADEVDIEGKDNIILTSDGTAMFDCTGYNYCFRIVDSHNIQMSNLTITSATIDGIFMLAFGESVSGYTATNIISHDNGGSGINVFGSTTQAAPRVYSGIAISDSIAYSNGTNGLLLSGNVNGASATVTISGNETYFNGASNAGAGITVSGSYVTDTTWAISGGGGSYSSTLADADYVVFDVINTTSNVNFSEDTSASVCEDVALNKWWQSGGTLCINQGASPSGEQVKIGVADLGNFVVENNISYSNHQTGVDGNGIMIDGFAHSGIIRNNITHDNAGRGIELGFSGPGYINTAHHNILYNDNDGVRCRSYGVGCEVYNNTSYNIEDEAFKCDVYATGCVFKNNIAKDSTTGFISYASSSYTFSNNLAEGNSSDDWASPLSAGVTNINSDPLLNNASLFDFKPTALSPAINAGTDVGLTTDFRGGSIGSSPDIGAYEIQSDEEYDVYYLRGDGVSPLGVSYSCDYAVNASNITLHNAATFNAGTIFYFCDDGGDFTTRITLPSSGTSGNEITYKNATGDSPVIDVPTDRGIETQQKDFIIFDGLSLRGGTATYGTIEIENDSDNITVQNCNITPDASARGVRIFYSTTNTLIDNVTFDGSNNVSAYLIHIFVNNSGTISGVDITNSSFTNSGSRDINLGAGTAITVSDINISNNTFTNGDEEGVYMLSGAATESSLSDLVINNNRFIDSGNSSSDASVLIDWEGTVYNFQAVNNVFNNCGTRCLDFSIDGNGPYYNIDFLGNYFTANNNQAIRMWPVDATVSKAYDVDIANNDCNDTGLDCIDVAWLTSASGTSYIRNNTGKDIGMTSNGANVNGIRIAASDDVIVEGNIIDNVDSTSGDGNCIIIDKHDLVSVYQSSGVIVRKNIGRNCVEQGGACISNYMSDDSVINNNLCYNNKTGISWGEDTGSAEQSSGGLIYNNTMANNTSYGARIRENALGSTWKNNISWGNTTQDYIVEAGGTAPITDYNLGSNYSNWTEGANGITSDPLFMNAAANNFGVQVDSPVIGAGDSSLNCGSNIGAMDTSFMIMNNGVVLFGNTLGSCN